MSWQAVSRNFSTTRMRRMRKDDFSRRMMRETVLTPDDFIWPVFVIEGEDDFEPVEAEMKKIIKAKNTFERKVVSKQDALDICNFCHVFAAINWKVFCWS